MYEIGTAQMYAISSLGGVDMAGHHVHLDVLLDEWNHCTRRDGCLLCIEAE